MTRALLMIDLSNDFVELDGSLHCGEAGQAIIPYCVELVRSFVESGQIVIDARDNHAMDDYEISSGLFPPHNIQGTVGQALIRPLADVLRNAPECWLQVSKKHYNAMFGTDLPNIIRNHQIHELHIIGVCTDICVRYTANGLYQFKTTEWPNLRIVVHRQGVASFNAEGHIDSLTHMPGAFGVEVV